MYCSIQIILGLNLYSKALWANTVFALLHRGTVTEYYTSRFPH
jgi:hypothetical protein